MEQRLALRVINCRAAFREPKEMSAMRIYVFKSEAKRRLRAFASDPEVNKLPRQHGPWTVTGTISPDNDPPYNFSRDAIEKARCGRVSALAPARQDGRTELTRRQVRSAPSLFPIATDAPSRPG
jgi:hypothetical protein